MISAEKRCSQRIIDTDSIVCVCNEIYCDDFVFTWDAGNSVHIQSSMSGKRFEVTKLDHVDHSNKLSRIVVDLAKPRQKLLGFGGAFTDAAVINIDSLPPKLAETLIESYFGLNGLEYSMARVPIAGTDFSDRPYSYDDADTPDFRLLNWSLADEDTRLKIPFIKKAIEIASKSGRNLQLFATSWSPPKWMKGNKQLVRGHLINSDQIYRIYAEYFMRFFDAYKQRGINFWGATVQNEPISAYLPFYWFNSMQFSESEQAKFISKFLGPALESRGYNKTNFKLIVGDDNLGFVNWAGPGLLRNPDVEKYVSGFAFHWYMNNILPYSSLSRVYEKIKDKVEFIIMSEACNGWSPSDRGVKLGDWKRGVSYASDIIEDLNRHTSAWIDWNLALDMRGGPNWAKNYVDSPILVDRNSREFYKQPMYYVLGHFSKFFKKGDTVVESTVNGLRHIKVTAAVGKEGNHTVINILNSQSIDSRIPVIIKNQFGQTRTFSVSLEKQSINTLIIFNSARYQQKT